MRDQELVSAIRRLKVETGSLACMGCGHEHNCGVSGCAVMREAADRIANQSTHILALQKEIAGLRKAVRWVHDGLYLCDPEKNTVCKKAAVKSSVFTPRSRRSRTLAETPAPQLRWIPVAERLPEDRSNVLVVAYWLERWGVYMGWCAPERAEWSVHVGIGDRDDVSVTHWMPLPSGPEVK